MAKELAAGGGDAPFAVELGALVISGRR
jgi:hypothetical protein